MNTIFRCVAAVLVSASLAVVVCAQSAGLDVKLGLWEITQSAGVGGMPGVDTSKMSPEQLAQIQAMMSAAGLQAHPMKTCLTKEKLEKETYALIMASPGNSHCKQKLTTNTSSALDGTVECRGSESPSQLHVEAASPTSIKGSIETTNTMRGRSMTTTMNVTGAWVGADCGKIK